MAKDLRTLTRRAVLAAGLASAATVTDSLLNNKALSDGAGSSPMSHKLPGVFIPHAGGPFSYVDMGRPVSEVEELVRYWQAVGALPKIKPRALLVVSAHWEQPVPTVMTSPAPPMLFDYYGFPPASYDLRWPAPGAPQLAERILELLATAGIQAATNSERGFDHGTFVPLGRAFPAADIPTLQLSLKSGLDPQEHLLLGRALAPLRSEGVFIIGSGMSYHNMQGFRSTVADNHARHFDGWLKATVECDRERREARLLTWADAPSARDTHPREEHLLPLHVIAGAAGDDHGHIAWNGTVFDKAVSAVQFG